MESLMKNKNTDVYIILLFDFIGKFFICLENDIYPKSIRPTSRK